MTLRTVALNYIKSRLGDDPPSLRLAFWDGGQFDFAPSPKVTITLGAPILLELLLRGNFAGLCDAYAVGTLKVDGPVEDIVRVGISLSERVGVPPTITKLGRLRSLLSIRKPHAREHDNIKLHYDISNEFYRLWLDENMVYSCAYFRTGSEDIHAAQRQKLDFICRKLHLEPKDRILDVGCGWGGLLHWAAKHYGADGVGITLSQRQFDYARKRLAHDGLGGKVEIRLQNYRDLDGENEFDKIVSVGMYEHVGLSNLPLYFRTIARLLKPGGTLLNNGIVLTDPTGRPQGPDYGNFIDRYVFPGGALTHLSKTIVEIASAGLEVVDVEDFRPHYAQTLLAWVRRLDASRREAIQAAGEQRYRIWRVYLAGMAYAFDRAWLSDAQVVAYKPLATGRVVRPWTREHYYRQVGTTELSCGLKWE